MWVLKIFPPHPPRVVFWEGGWGNSPRQSHGVALAIIMTGCDHFYFEAYAGMLCYENSTESDELLFSNYIHYDLNLRSCLEPTNGTIALLRAVL